MRWYEIVKKDLKIILTDKLAWILMILLPLVVLCVAGFALSGMFKEEVPDMILGYYYEGNESNIEPLLHSFEEMNQISLEKVDELKEGKRRVKDEKITALMIIPKEFHLTKENAEATIEYIYSVSNQSTADMLSGVTQGIIENLNSNSAAIRMLVEQGMQTGSVREEDLPTYIEKVSNELHGADTIQMKSTAIDGDADNKSFYQIIPGFTIMFLLFSILSGSSQIIEERKNRTLQRMLIAPVNKMDILFSKWLGMTLIAFLQSIILFTVGHFLFGLSLGVNPFILLTFMLIVSCAIGAIGVCIASVAKSFKQANGISMLIILAMSALGGSWWPLDITPAFMQNIGKFTFSYWAISGVKKIIIGECGFSGIAVELAIMASITILLVGISYKVFKYE